MLDAAALQDLQILDQGSLRGKDAACYARTSGPGQHSVPDQFDECRKLADSRGSRVRYLIKDESESGEDPARPGFNRLLELALAGLIKVLYVWKIDRLARTLADAAQVEQLFHEAGCAIVSVTEPIDTSTPTGRFLLGIMSSTAQLEMSNLRERVALRRTRLMREGRWVNGRAPFGYRKVRGARLRRAANEAEQVPEVYQLALETGSYARTAQAMNAAGRDWRGTPWTAERARRIIQADIYSTGRLSERDEHAGAPRLVSEDLASRVRKHLHCSPKRGKQNQSMRQEAIRNVFAQYRKSLDLLED